MSTEKHSMTALQPLRYAKRSMVVGDEFEATHGDAKVLSLIGKARYHTRVMVAEDVPVVVRQDGDQQEKTETEAERVKRKYTKRAIAAA